MTEKLYYTQPELLEFSARALCVRPQGEQWRVLLDRTAFYPEGGGQPADHGALGGARVLDVQAEDGDIWHLCDRELAEGAQLTGRLDAARRLRYTQQHTAQHVLSAVLRQRFGAQTLSVHFGEEQTTLDTDLPLDEAALAQAEAETAAFLRADIPVRCFFPAPQELDMLRLRKAPPANGEALRIVEIGELDYTACCGTHCQSTAQAGILCILRAESYKGGTRLAFVCGEQAREKLSGLWERSRALQQLLAVGEAALPARVEKLHAENLALKKERQTLLDELTAQRAGALLAGAEAVGRFRLVCQRLDADAATRRALLAALTEQPGVLALLGARESEGAALFFGCSRQEAAVDVRPLFQSALALVEGKGGGSRFSCQGQGKAVERLDEALRLAKEAAREMLREDGAKE